MLAMLTAAWARLDDSLIGDAIGAAALFALLWIGLLAGAVLGG